jgi:7-carboxy-7-deazaguanine synthase
MYAVDPKHPGWKHTMMSAVQIVVALPTTQLVTISGGNPALYVDRALLDTLEQHGHRIAMESQGTMLGTWVNHPSLIELTISPKPPSSGMSDRYTPDVVDALYLSVNSRLTGRRHTTLKYVFSDDADLDWIVSFDRKMPINNIYIDRFLSICTPTKISNDFPAMQAYIVARIEHLLKDERFEHFRVLPQLHVLLYGSKRGV